MLCAHLLTRRAVGAKASTSASAPWASNFNERNIAEIQVEKMWNIRGKRGDNVALMEFLMMQASPLTTKRVKCVFMAR